MVHVIYHVIVYNVMKKIKKKKEIFWLDTNTCMDGTRLGSEIIFT